MTFELFVYRAQMFAVKLQSKPGRGFFILLQQAGGAWITQFLMALCFGKIMAEGQRQWLKQSSAKSVNRK